MKPNMILLSAFLLTFINVSLAAPGISPDIMPVRTILKQNAESGGGSEPFSYTEDFSGAFDKTGYTNFRNAGINDWTDVGALGRISIQTAATALSAWSWDAGTALVDYDVTFKLVSAVNYYRVSCDWYVRVKDDTHYCEIQYAHNGPFSQIGIGGTWYSVTAIGANSIIKTTVRASGANVVIVVYDDDVQIATRTYSASGIESGTFGFGGTYISSGGATTWDIDDIEVVEQ